MARRICNSLLIVVCVCVSHAVAQRPDPTQLIRSAIEAQGGESVLRSIKNFEWTLTGYRNMLEQSERPEGPYVVEFHSRLELHDYQNARYLERTEAKVYPAFAFTQSSIVAGGIAMRVSQGQKLLAAPDQVQLARERMALSPEHLILTALDASDLRAEGDTVLQSIPQNVLVFTLDDAPVRIFLNAYTHLPTAVDYTGPLARSGYWRFLGDVTSRTLYSSWWLGKDGIRLPMQWNTERNGLPEQTYFVQKVQTNGTLDEEALSVPAPLAVKRQSPIRPTSMDDVPLGNPANPAVELSPGVILIPGPWNVTLVRQDDGVVILEAPISSSYSAKVIAEAHRRFPGAPIKAVVTTSDSWPHLAGIREYAATGIPIYTLDLNQPILSRITGSPYTSRPDQQQRHPRQPLFRLVKQTAKLASKTNPLNIYPIRGETSERQMMVYFPQTHMLYGSDPFQRSPTETYTFPQTVTELTDAVQREHLAVSSFFMMHVPPTPWSDLQKAVNAAEHEDSPNGILQ